MCGVRERHASRRASHTCVRRLPVDRIWCSAHVAQPLATAVAPFDAGVDVGSGGEREHVTHGAHMSHTVSHVTHIVARHTPAAAAANRRPRRKLRPTHAATRGVVQWLKHLQAWAV